MYSLQQSVLQFQIETIETSQEHFINKHGGKEREGQDPETLKKKKARFDNKGTLLNLTKSHSALDKQLLHA